MDKNAITLGFQIGRILAGQRRKMPVPVAYMYNGMKLPALPDWVKEWPYLYMYAQNGYYYLCGFKTMPETVEKTQAITHKKYDYHLLAEKADWAGDWVRPYNSCEWWGHEVYNSDGGRTLTYIFWSNYDIYTSSGDLFLAASEPVPVYAGPMYSFNGKILPQIPEIDTTVYPYRVIAQDLDEGERARWMLFGFSQKPSMWVSTSSGKPYYGNEDGPAICYSTDSKGGFWYEEPAASWTNGSNVSAEVIVWADHDVYDENGNLVLKASEPVPIYE